MYAPQAAFTAAVLVGFMVFLMAYGALVLRVGPRRGTWNQPAAKLQKPGFKVVVGMWTMAGAQLALSVVIAARVPGVGGEAIVVAFVTGCIYVFMAYGYQFATAVTTRRTHH